MSEVVTNENQRAEDLHFSPKRQLPSKFQINRTSRKSKNNANAACSSQSDLKPDVNAAAALGNIAANGSKDNVTDDIWEPPV